jgi:hypothetical protein
LNAEKITSKKTNMKTTRFSLLTISLFIGLSVAAQKVVTIPEISQVQNSKTCSLLNRKVDIQPNGTIHLNGQPGTGLLWMNDLAFTNGVIECDIMGRNVPGRSFVGIAFHGLNDTTYDAVYFRPFNFKNEERNGHSIHYISHHENTWYKLREEHPGKYENKLDPVPDPE